METVKIRLGCSFGAQGYIAADINGELLLQPIPILKKEYDLNTLNNIFASFKQTAPWQKIDIHCCLENIRSISYVGRKRNFKFGRDVGIIDTMLAIYKIPSTKVISYKWQSVGWKDVKTQRKENLNNIRGFSIDVKKTSLLAAKKLYPQVYFDPIKSKVPYDEKANALLLMYYCLRNFK